ncbi:MAG: HAD family hydrolase [Halobacteriales archaeon]
MYDSVVLDFDGVLVEPTRPEVAYGAVERAFEQHGISLERSEVERLVSVSADGLRELCRRHDVGADAVWSTRERHVAEAQKQAYDDGLKPAYPDLEALDSLDGRAVAIASNNQRETVEYVVRELGISERVETVVAREPTLEDLERKKPRPDFVERATEALDAENPVYVGDREKDVVAARRAGVDSVFVRRSHNRSLEVEATHETRSLHDVVELVGDAGSVQADSS